MVQTMVSVYMDQKFWIFCPEAKAEDEIGTTPSLQL